MENPSKEEKTTGTKILTIQDAPRAIQKKTSPRSMQEANENYPTINNKSITHKTTSSLPRSSSHNPYLSESSDQSSSNSQKKELKIKRGKSNSINDRMSLLQKRKHSKDLMADQKKIIISEKEKQGSTPIKLSQSAPLENSLTTPYQSSSSASLCDKEHKTTITTFSAIKHNESFSNKSFSYSGESSNNRSLNILKKSSKSIANQEIDIMSAIRSGNIKILKQCINNPNYNLNKPNEYGMTPLHCATLEAVQMKNHTLTEIIKSKNCTMDEAIQLKNGKIIELLLSAERLDSTIKNKHNQTASELIQGGDMCDEIRKPLFARITLEKFVFREMFIMIMNLYIKKQSKIDEESIATTIKSIRTKIQKVENSQGDSELPDEAKIPTYAQDNQQGNTFVKNMILSRIPKMSSIIKKLIMVINKEITALLFENTPIENNKIKDLTLTIMEQFEEKDLIQTIKEQFKQAEKLPPFINYEILFYIIRDSIKEKKCSIELPYLESHEEKK